MSSRRVLTQGTVLISCRKIWILEDDPGCRFVYEEILNNLYDVVFFDSLHMFKTYLDKFKTHHFNDILIIADLTVKDGHFMSFLEKNDLLLNKAFIVVSSDEEMDSIRQAFKGGALDYLTKPFKKPELIVKIENIFNQIDKRLAGEQEVYLDGHMITNLTGKQVALLRMFLGSETREVKRQDILQNVWGDMTVHPKTVDVHLYNLRRKIHPYGYLIRSEGGGRWRLLSERIDQNNS